MMTNNVNNLDDLQISLIDLPRQPGASRLYEFLVDVPSDLGVYDVKVVNDVLNLKVRLTCVTQGVLVDLSTDVEINSACYRCLDDVTENMDICAQELFYYPDMRQKLLDCGDEDLQQVFEVENDCVDLTTLVRDSIVLELPMRMLCDESCLGLCPYCAKKFVDLEPNHSHEFIDDRWKKLEGFAIKLRENKND